MEDTPVVDTGPDDNERCRSWHDKWVNDASQKEDMFEISQYFVIAIDWIKEKVLSLPSAKIGCISGMRIKTSFILHSTRFALSLQPREQKSKIRHNENP